MNDQLKQFIAELEAHNHNITDVIEFRNKAYCETCSKWFTLGVEIDKCDSVVVSLSDGIEVEYFLRENIITIYGVGFVYSLTPEETNDAIHFFEHIINKKEGKQ